MRDERIEERLRERPADEPPYTGRLAPTLMPVPARRPHVRGREGRRAISLGVVLSAVVGVGVIGLLVSSLGARAQPSSPGSVASSDAAATSTHPDGSRPLGVIPWLDAPPSPAPTSEPSTDPGEFPSCTSDELVLVAGGWGGATGSMAGGASVINLGSNPCTVGGKPEVDLLDGSGRVIAHGVSATAPNHDELVVLETGAEAGVITVWTNWCGEPPARPLQVFLTLPRQGGTLSTEIRDDGSGALPRCDDPGAGSSFGVPLAFAAPEPSSGGYQPEDCAAVDLAAYLGTWGGAAGTSYANLVVVNRGHVDCLLEISPTFELRDANGSVVVRAASEPPPASASQILLPPGWAAAATIGYADWCNPPPALPLTADLIVGRQPLVIVGRSEVPVPYCVAEPATPPPNLFYEGALRIPGSPIAPEPDPIDSIPVSVSLPALPDATPGAVLAYSIVLTNVTPFDKPLNLVALCPPYTERLILPDGRTVDTTLQLNCGAAGWLEPGHPLTFAMRLAIPSDAPPGQATLIWQLGSRGPAMKVSLTIGP